MKSIKLFILIFVLLTPNLYSQNLNFFAQLVGTWEASYDDMSGSGDKNLEKWNVQWILNKYFIQIDIHGDNTRGSSTTYDEKYLFTIDDNNNIVGWGFDANPSIYFMNMTGKNTPDGVKIQGKGKNINYNFSLELKDRKLIRIFKNDSSDIEVVYVKK